MKVKIFAISLLVAVICSTLVREASCKSPKTSETKNSPNRSTTPATKATKTHPKSVSDGSSTLKSSKTDNTKATKMPTQIPKPDKDIPCVLRNSSCGYCTDDSNCFYCESESSCRKYEKIKIVPRHCKGNKWFWKQCKVAGNILIIAVPTLIGVFLIMLGCCVYCCCCRKRCGKNSTEREEARQRQNRQDRQQRNEERRTTRQARHDAIRMKYGLLQNEADDDCVA